MNDTADIESLLARIRQTIRGRLDGSIPIERVKDEYVDMLARYKKLELVFHSPESGGFIKGMLYHHNRRHGAKLTAIFTIRDGIPEPVTFAGDKILLNALPDLISRAMPDIESGAIRRAALSGVDASASADANRFNLTVKKIKTGSENLILAAVTSDPGHDEKDFAFLSELIGHIFEKNNNRNTPASMNWVRDISADIYRTFHAGAGARFFIDQYQLLHSVKSFSYIGLHPMINFSDYIVDTLKKYYPEEIRLYALSVINYLVLYDEKIRDRISARRDRLEFSLHGNNIPYKLVHREIDGPKALSLFLEEL